MAQRFLKTTTIDAPVEEVFAWHERPGAFERLAPPWQSIRLISAPPDLSDGNRVEFELRMGPKGFRWVAEHYDYIKNEQFCDRQIEGPFAFWQHRHSFIATPEGGTEIRDHVEFAVPFESIARAFAGSTIRKRIRAVFAYRSATLQADFALHKSLNLPPQRILIAGSSGLVGSALIPLLTTGGHSVTRLVRRPVADGEAAITWDPVAGFAPEDLEKLEGFDAVINLAGESIMGYFSEAKKKRIRESRLTATNNLVEAISRLDKKPKVLISASAIGIYGSRGDEVLTEDSEFGDSFLATVCQDWEAAANKATAAGIRVVTPRIGVVLSPRGGALGYMKIPFALGVGGKIGRGDQYMSWISIDDLISIFLFAIATPTLKGPINACAPAAATNAELSRSLARALSRPSVFPAPESIVRGALREAADEILLSSVRAKPEKLLAAGYRFRHRDLDETFRHLLGQNQE